MIVFFYTVTMFWYQFLMIGKNKAKKYWFAQFLNLLFVLLVLLLHIQKKMGSRGKCQLGPGIGGGIVYRAGAHSSEKKVCAQRNVPVKFFKICYILCIRNVNIMKNQNYKVFFVANFECFLRLSKNLFSEELGSKKKSKSLQDTSI